MKAPPRPKTNAEFIKKFKPEWNSNSLVDIACPKCGSRRGFVIEATTTFAMTDEGSEDHGDVEWNDGSYIACGDCNHYATVADFTFDGLDDAISDKDRERHGDISELRT